MSIKAVDNIPVSTHPKTIRDKIRADIAEAIERDISLFEFTGDYNYNTLASNVRDVLSEMARKNIHSIHRRFRMSAFTDDERNIRGFFCVFKSSYDYRKDFYITVTSTKGEQHRRVFCKIDDYKLFEKKVIADCNVSLIEARKEHRLVDGKWVWKPKKRGE